MWNRIKSALACNIDACGKRARWLAGLVTLAIGAISLVAWALPSASASAWTFTAFLLIAGVFCVFESLAGWCALRAMGFKTRI